MIPLELATRLAEALAAQMAPHCDRVEVAGSIRRGRPMVNDIDLVALPNDFYHLRAWWRRLGIVDCEGAEIVRVRCSSCDIKQWFPEYQTYHETLEDLFPGDCRVRLQVDIFLAHHEKPDLFEPEPGNWGTMLLSKTGSLEHNLRVCSAATDRGLHWAPHKGVQDGDGKIIASEKEKDVLEAVGLGWIPPEKREVEQERRTRT